MIFGLEHLFARARGIGALAAVTTLFAVALSPLALGANAKAKAPAKVGTYRGAIVVDAASGNVLFEDQADEISPPASMTKLMTFAVLSDLLAQGKITLQTPVPIDPSDEGMGGTQVYLSSTETFPVEELIYAMMIQSANDAAHALARASTGSVEAFVELMNTKAKQLGMTRTTFRSPHGLPPSTRRNDDGDLTTARDFATLSRYLLLRTDVVKYTSVARRPFGPQRAKGPFLMDNHNHLLGSVAGVDGLKTGYTKSAGYCISATAERNGRRVIVVVMGSFGPGGQIDKGVWRDRKVKELIERGFSALPAEKPTFALERAKYARPPVISLDQAAPAAGSNKPTPTPASAEVPQQPSIKFSLPRK